MLKQYVRLGGLLLRFNVDRNFSTFSTDLYW